MMNLNNKTAIDPQFDSRVQMFLELELTRVTIYESLPGASWSALYIYVAVFSALRPYQGHCGLRSRAF